MASSNDKESRIFELDEVPKGSRLEKYLKEIPEVQRRNEALAFLDRVFKECLGFFLSKNQNIPYLPSNGLGTGLIRKGVQKTGKNRIRAAP